MPKSLGRHPVNALTAIQVRSLKTAGRYADGNGLYLVIDATGARRWLLRTMVHGRRRDIGLGSAQLVSLVEARERATTYRKIARDGGDPLQHRAKERVIVPTFAEAAERVHEEHKSAWKNAKHTDQWINTIRQYANPTIGTKAVNVIETPDVLAVLTPIWQTKPETARRMRQRLRTVFDWAKASGFRSGENPVEGVSKGLPKQIRAVQHHSALPFQEVPAFVTSLRASGSGIIAKHAFEFLIQTAGRTNEVLGAQWSEIDRDAGVWTVPAERMKAKKPHRVPLNSRCVEILKEAAEYKGTSSYLFQGRDPKRPMSNMVFSKIMGSLKVDATPHGFRSAFRDWAAEVTSFPREVAEMALAHTIESKVEAAYRRGDLLDKRRVMMEEWGDYLGRAVSGK
jgi:integrase